MSDFKPIHPGVVSCTNGVFECRASKCSRRNCECVANGLYSTTGCTCEADRELCENKLNNQDSSDSDSNDTMDEEDI